MFRYLFSKTALFLAAMFVLTVVALGYYMVQTVRTINEEANQQMHRHLADHILYDSPLLPENLTDKKAVKDAFHMMMVFGPNLELYILDAQGKILNYSAQEGKVLRDQVDLAPIQRFLDNPKERLIQGQDPRSTEQKKPFSVARIEHNGELVGYLYIIIGSEIYDDAISGVVSDSALSASLVPIGLLLLTSLLTALFIYVVIAKPLNELVLRLQRTNIDDADAAGQSVPAIVGRADEIGHVEEEFERFFGKIRHQYKLLEDKKNAQHLLFNQIAHDLRTPLTNAMLSLENAERQLAENQIDAVRNSLSSARSNYKKVISFVSGMLDLARLESGQTQLSREPFPLEELVHDCVQDFEVAASESKMNLVVNADNRHRLVDIDIPHLARVINNLISNSLRYAIPGTAIELSLSEHEGLMRFSISNEYNQETLRTMPDLNSDYQFKSPSKMGYGLGLAICQRILKLHETQLGLETQESNRISFHFSLPLCAGN